MHDSVTTMLMRCKMAVINHIGIGTTWCIYVQLRALQTPIKILHQNLPPWPRWRYGTDRQSHRTTRKGKTKSKRHESKLQLHNITYHGLRFLQCEAAGLEECNPATL